MDNFDSFRRGILTHYDPAVKSIYYRDIDPNDFKIPEENHEAFKLGLALGSDHFMVHTADGSYDYERDIAGYNRTVDQINELLGAEVVNHVVAWSGGKNRYTAVHPETGLEVFLFKNH